MKKCLIIDSYGFIFRAFHVQPPLTSPSGQPVGAIFGFTSMLIKLFTEQNPTHAVAVFDAPGKNFRHEIYSDYKAHRPDVPEDLIKQFPVSRDIVSKLNITQIEKSGYEADDVIASLARKISDSGEEVIIVSSDKDLAQLMSEKIKIYDPSKSKFISREDILEKFGVEPPKIRDYLAIVGDKSDNIPGVPSFGPKTAAELINKFGSVPSIIENLEKIENERRKSVLRENLEKLELSYELARLDEKVDLTDIGINQLLWKKPLHSDVNDFINEFGFKSLSSRVMKICQKDDNNAQLSLLPTDSQPYSASSNVAREREEILNDLAYFESLAKDSGIVSILKTEEKYLLETSGKVFEIKNLEEISEILSNSAILKILPNVKDYSKAAKINSYEDLSIMNYILTAGKKQMNIDDMFQKYFQKSFSSFEICTNMKALYLHLKQKLFEEKDLNLYYEIDLPISSILLKMNLYGVKFDKEKLAQLSQEFEALIKDLEKKIFEIAGCEFNIGSTKQLAEILFEKLKLPASSKNSKSGSFSTNVEVLESLSEQNFEIADYLLKWRHISKLKNTYTDAIPKVINPDTGRVHTTLLQTSTTTGRLSSVEPNLQNIPVKSDEGAKIRHSIIAEKNHTLISADYSQIELRILAEIADIAELKSAFANNIDIHSKTASQVFEINIENVTPDLRRKAKAINFGIIYGISGFGLAKQLGISRSEAKEYIEKYFRTYPGIKEYMDREKKHAANFGYVKNIFGRKCFVESVNSSSAAERSFGERAAINAPIQGSASDIAKLAMIKMEKKIEKLNLKSKLILQIHDELLFEVPLDEVDIIKPIIKNVMETVVDFKPSLKVDIDVSDYWS